MGTHLNTMQKRKDKSCCSYTCGVCGDGATSYRLYGAEAVCHSCRIFFRRTVQAKKTLTCVVDASVKCTFDKFTRNRCRGCRYSKCLDIGMNPYLVGSCKQIDVDSDFTVSESSLQKILIPAPKNSAYQVNSSVKALNHQDCSKEALFLKYEQVSDIIYLHPEGLYMQKLFQADQAFYEQARVKKKKIEFPTDYVWTLKKVLDSIASPFLETFLPELSNDLLQRIAESSSITLLGLILGLEQCFVNESILDQFQYSCIVSPAFVDLWRTSFPELKTLKALPLDSYDMLKSPWTPNIEDENFVEDTFEIFVNLVSGDVEVAKLLNLLALFSPVKVVLSTEETFYLKHFQRKISVEMYTHVLARDTCNNIDALERVTGLGKMIEKMNRCGEIFHDSIIYHSKEDILEDIETIDLVELTSPMF